MKVYQVRYNTGEYEDRCIVECKTFISRDTAITHMNYLKELGKKFPDYESEEEFVKDYASYFPYVYYNGPDYIRIHEIEVEES